LLQCADLKGNETCSAMHTELNLWTSVNHHKLNFSNVCPYNLTPLEPHRKQLFFHKY